MSIKKSIQILLITSSMLPLILTSVITHRYLSDKLIYTNTQSLQQTAENSMKGLEALLETQETEVSLLAMHKDILELADNNRKELYDPTLVNTLLHERTSSYEDYVTITLYDINSNIIASSTSKAEQKVISTDTLQAMVTSKTSTLVIDELGSESGQKDLYTIDISAPVVDSLGNILGYVVSTIDINYFTTYLNSISFGDSLGILLNHKGNIIYHTDQSQIGTMIQSQKSKDLVARYQLGELKQSGAYIDTFESKKHIFGYCIMPKLNWVFLVHLSSSKAVSFANVLLSVLIYVCLVLFVAVLVFANILAKKFSAPIIALRDAMRTASDGNLTVQSNIKSKNELGELSKNFNKMLHIIKTNYDDLESMHEELLANEEELRSNYEHIEYLAYHDTLTNLPNKLAFLDYVNAELSASSSDKIHAVFFVDLDNFKTINDTLGHEYGDTLLIKTAQLLTSIIGSEGMLARAGGDEFLIFMRNIASKESATQFAAQIIDTFKNPLDLGGEIVYVSMSIGISIYPENGLTPNALIKNADIAMYKSKDTGKNKFTLFDAKMEEELNRNTIILEVLRNAIENNEIYIQYQPLMELETNNVIGFEALMRIKSQRLGDIPPSEFIPIAEESGLIIELSSWLIREACKFNKEMIDLGITPRPVSVNISSVQINRPGFVPLLSSILEETQLPPQYLELEITESTLVSSLMDATQMLNNLQQLGVKVSLDDFGTGYSSLNYLTKMPIDTLKIDKSFIDNICTNSKDSRIAESIIQLAHSLDIKVVAEGVEHDDQLILLKAQRCDIVQGYIYNPPLHPEELLEVIRNDDLITQCSLFN